MLEYFYGGFIMSKQRHEIEEKYQWDLTTIFPTDEAWEAELADLQAETEKQKNLQVTCSTQRRAFWKSAKRNSVLCVALKNSMSMRL